MFNKKEYIKNYMRELRKKNPSKIKEDNQKYEKYRKKWRDDNQKEIKQYMKEYKKEWYSKNKIYFKEWRKNNKDKCNQYAKNWRKNPFNKNKYKARNIINDLIKINKIPKANTLKCIKCGLQAQEYHHYLGYEKENWDKVIPLCKECHKKEVI